MAPSKTIVDSALWNALEQRSSDLLDRLLYEGSHPDARNFKGATPLTYAIERFDLNMIDTLLSHGADPNLPNAFDTTPLMACCIGFQPGAEILLRHGADPQTLNRFGQNPAAWAQRHPDDPLARLILDFDPSCVQRVKLGAKIDARDRHISEIKGASDLSRLLDEKRKALAEALAAPIRPRSPNRN